MFLYALLLSILESLLTITNLVTVVVFRQALEAKEKETQAKPEEPPKSCSGNGGVDISESLAQGESRAENGTKNALLRVFWTNVEAP